ncbi:MAG: DUF4910 domain-containing protein [Candidatus Bathyarchaeota archaeon]|nr:MAG: DUF4910 domain-containing protein [Candidatus Bathyarchaeota archaeon]
MNIHIAKAVKDTLSGETAKSYVSRLTDFHRVQASTMFHEAAEYVKDTLITLGLNDARIEQFRSDGTTKYWTWTSPMGWTVETAELRLIEPEDRLLARYEDTPTSLHTYSKSTPSKGVVAELVDVGAGTKPEDYKDKKVKGKFVLATGAAKKVHEQAVYKFGAAAVITDSLTHETKNVRESLDVPDATAYQSIWPTAKDLPKVTFGFSLTKRQGTQLRTLMKKGTALKLKAHVNAKLRPGCLDVVSAKIQGTSKAGEEVLLVAHLCHPKPSANDNASGSGLLLEIVRTIITLIESGKINRPLRSIRFLWVPEFSGSIAYMHKHEDASSKLIAGINLDMVGQNQELCKSTLNLDKTPDSNPSYLNDYVFNLIKRSVDEFDPVTAFGSASTFRYAVNSFSGGSDHAVFNDSSVNVPCVMLLQWPDLYYHTSMDSIDKVSEKSLKRVGWITTVAALMLASAIADDVTVILNLTRLGGLARLEDVSRKATLKLFNVKSENSGPTLLSTALSGIVADFQNELQHVVWREQTALESARQLKDNSDIKRLVNTFKEDIEVRGELEKTRFQENFDQIMKTIKLPHREKSRESKVVKLTKKLVPKRLFKGPFNSDALKTALGEDEFQWHENITKEDKDFNKKIYEFFNFMDGKRSLYEITKAVSAEYSKTQLEHVLKYMNDLEKTHFISYE